jgi:PHP family Zn ribbon phosphoesterase
MDRYKYDLHIHSCLSPCGDSEMTPNNIVNMAKLLGFDIIAITDHNSSLNASAVVRAGEKEGLLVIPGMEICTSEEAHVVCLFRDTEKAENFSRYVYDRMPDVKNKPEIFGRQDIMDDSDKITGTLERLLITATSISVNDILSETRKFGGTAFPAHINREAYSVVSALGYLPEEAGFKCVEITADCDIDAFRKEHPEIEGLHVLTDSDTHYLENFRDPGPWVELPEKTADSAIDLIDGTGKGDFSPFGAT